MPSAVPIRKRFGLKRRASSCWAPIMGRISIRSKCCRARAPARFRSMRRATDYHDVLKKKLKRLAGFIAEEFDADVKVFVDTAPVLEKPLAQAAGLGWQGKHTNLVSREFGSWLFLGSVFTTLALEPDEAESDHCGQCRRLSRYLSDQGVSRALPTRCAALHFLSHHRAQGPHRARIPRGDGQSHLWLRRLPGRLSVEQVRADFPRDAIPCARGTAQPTPCRSRAPRRCRLSRNLPRLADQAHRARPLRAQCPDRRSEIPAMQRLYRRRSLCLPILRRWCAPWPCGRFQICSTMRNSPY